MKYEVRRNYRSPGFERPKKVLSHRTTSPNDLNESCLEPYVNFKMLLPRWNQSWWCRCSFDKLYLWTITCGLVLVLTRQIIGPAPTGQSQRLSGPGPPTFIMTECSLSCHWSEAEVLAPDWSIVRVSHVWGYLVCDQCHGSSSDTDTIIIRGERAV